MKKLILHQAGTCLIWALLFFVTSATFAQSVTITVNATQNKRLISPYRWGKNEGFDKSDQFYKDAGLRFAQMNGGTGLNPGMYIVRIEDFRKRQSFKIIKK